MEKIFVLCFTTLTLGEVLSFVFNYSNKNIVVRIIKFSLYLFTFILSLFESFFIPAVCLGIAIIDYVYMYKYNKQYGELDKIIKEHADNLYQIPKLKKIFILSGVCFLNLVSMMIISVTMIMKFF